MFKRISVTLMLLLLVSSVLIGCSATPAPVTFSQLPVFTGANLVSDPAITDLGDKMTEAMKTAVADKLKAIESKVYSLPADAKWDGVSSFFSTELAKDNWKSQSEYARTTDTANVLGWARGNQTVIIYYVIDQSGTLGGNLLVTMLIDLK